MNIGERIKDLRTKENLSQSKLANKIGVTKATISQYEIGGIKNIPSDKLQKIATALNTSPQYLLGLPESVKVFCKMPTSNLVDSNSSEIKPEIDLSSNNFAYVYKGRKVTSEEMKYIRRILKNTD